MCTIQGITGEIQAQSIAGRVEFASVVRGHIESRPETESSPTGCCILNVFTLAPNPRSNSSGLLPVLFATLAISSHPRTIYTFFLSFYARPTLLRACNSLTIAVVKIRLTVRTRIIDRYILQEIYRYNPTKLSDKPTEDVQFRFSFFDLIYTRIYPWNSVLKKIIFIRLI